MNTMLLLLYVGLIIVSYNGAIIALKNTKLL